MITSMKVKAVKNDTVIVASTLAAYLAGYVYVVVV